MPQPNPSQQHATNATSQAMVPASDEQRKGKRPVPPSIHTNSSANSSYIQVSKFQSSDYGRQNFSKLIPFHIFFSQSSNKKQMRWRSQLMPPGQWSSSFIQWLGSRNRTASSTWTHIVSKQNLLVAKGSTTVIFH